MSTCGVFHSIGSDLTRTRGRSEAHQNGSIRSEQTVSRARDHGNTPTSRAKVSLSGHELHALFFLAEIFSYIKHFFIANVFLYLAMTLKLSDMLVMVV